MDRRKNLPENAALVDECHGNLGNSPSSSDTLHNPEDSDGSPKVSKGMFIEFAYHDMVHFWAI